MKLRQLHIFYIIIYLVLVHIKVQGQDITFAKFSGGLYKFHIDSHSYNKCCTGVNPDFNARQVYDLTITPDGDVYSNMFFPYFIYSVNIDTINDKCNYNFEAKNNYYYDFNSTSSAIHSNKAGDIFCVSQELLKYYPKTKSWEYIGDIPDFYQDNSKGFTPYEAQYGTMILYNGDYYYTTLGHYFIGSDKDTLYPQKLVKLDTLNPQNSKELYTFDKLTRIAGMTCIRNSCDDYSIYVFYSDVVFLPSIHDNGDTTFYMGYEGFYFGDFDIETGKITEISKLDSTFYQIIYYPSFPTMVPWTILDSDCTVSIDLDLDDSSGATGKYDYGDTSVCRYDSINLTDIDAEVFAKTYIDSMQVFFADMPPDGADEYLETNNPGGLGIHWYNPRFVTLINNTNDDFVPMDIAAKSMIYRNVSAMPTLGERRIAFVAYSGIRQSNTAYAHIYLVDDTPYAGSDSVVILCEGGAAIQLQELISANANGQGKWIGNTAIQGVFDPEVDEATILEYVVETACGTDTALIDIEVNPLPAFDLGPDITVCTDKLVQLKCDIDARQYLWQDGSNGKTYQARDSGLYILKVTDEAGCTFTDSVRITYFPGENSRIEEDTTVCSGEIISWHNLNIDKEGDYEYTTDNIYGCDSTTILHVEYFSGENNRIEEDTIVCLGEIIRWHNLDINKEGDYEYTTGNIYGCDSTTVLHVEYFPLTNTGIYGDTLFCSGDTLILQSGSNKNNRWSTGDTTKSIVITQGGKYYLQTDDQYGCTNTDSIEIIQVPALEINVETTDETCYNEQDGSIIVRYKSGGIGTKTYYLNGEPVTQGSKIKGLSPGIYTIEAEDSLGCSLIQQVKIKAAPQIQVSLGDDITVEDTNNAIKIKANTNITSLNSVNWLVNNKQTTNDKLTYSIAPLEDMTIEVILVNINGCEVRDTIKISVRQKEKVPEIYIPNIFTPDGDGLNDRWTIHTDKNIKQIKYIAIFDRWGNQVLKQETIQANNIDIELWDGMYKGKPVNPGVYVYYAVFLTHQGKKIEKAGDVTVVR